MSGRLARLLGLVAAVTLLTFVLADAAGITGERRRQLGDVGDDWRSLLLGAPPALA